MRGPYKSQGWWVGKQRMRAVESLEVSNSRECSGPILAGAMAPGEGRVNFDYTVFYELRARLYSLPHWQWVVPTLHTLHLPVL